MSVSLAGLSEASDLKGRVWTWSIRSLSASSLSPSPLHTLFSVDQNAPLRSLSTTAPNDSPYSRISILPLSKFHHELMLSFCAS